MALQVLCLDPNIRGLQEGRGQLLKEFGVDIVLAHGVNKALELIYDPQAKIDLLLVDHEMREMNCIEFARMVQKKRPDLQMIFLSPGLGFEPPPKLFTAIVVKGKERGRLIDLIHEVLFGFRMPLFPQNPTEHEE